MQTEWTQRYEGLIPRVRNLVNGEWGVESGGVVHEKYSPRDGRLLYAIHDGDGRAVQDAITAARRTFEAGVWSKAAPQLRRDTLLRLAAAIDQHRDDLALLECMDVGKPIGDALNFDIPAASAVIRFNAEALEKVYGKVYGASRSNLSYELRRPVGVVVGIVGWNFPLVLAASKIGPALATGNSLVLKPSELTSLSATRIAELALEAGVPPGVFNVVNGGAPTGAAFARHPGVDLLSFTGSSSTGRKLLVASGESNMKRLVLECGGKAPNIVFDDCPDLDSVARAITMRAFWNQGQVCTASSRLLVQDSVAAELLPRIVRIASEINAGDPLDPDTRFGAVVSRTHEERVRSYVDFGEKQGATRIYHSEAPKPFDEGFYVPPTIFTNVLVDHRLAQEEIFGPVLSVLTFRDEAEAVRLANATIYGLSAIVWTTSLARAHRLSHDINAAWVVVNATAQPIGGPGPGTLAIAGHKHSGLGVEGGLDGLMEYTSNTAVQLFV